MTNPVPLLIVMGTIVALLVIQRLLARATNASPIEPATSAPAAVKPAAKAMPADARVVPPTSATKAAAPTPPPRPRPRGRPLVPGLSVAGLDERGTDSLRALIKNGKLTALTTFLAFNRPSVVELDGYLEKVRGEFLATLPQAPEAMEKKALRKALRAYTPPTPPAGMQLSELNNTELLQLLTFDPKAQRLISRDLMARFGGHDFNVHFPRYCALEKSVTLHVPPFDADRLTFEALAEAGVADKGRLIPLPQRLTVLKMNELRQMAKDLNYDRKFTRKIEATEELAKRPGAAVLLSMHYIVDDLFWLKPIAEDPEGIKDEWTYLTAYAKLLASITAKATPLEQA